ncbi:MAG: HAD-IA family hydrolase [Candidatus Nanoarchaeia archaeon]|nr:HAD-IA family hydrolase [Candidatus Nanoarchaeia archaeon]MDD5358103.1 HAD-IA family hydrolase [Candidatus Nanoarchaeia archaeon]MDD5589290.1 HAD-IA family hydrolase [Candidatus Nanoarchaeia archaeon]
MKIESIIFDFDGVLVKSNQIRNQTYFDILSHVPNSKKIIEEAIAEDSKRDRYGIIEAVLQELKDKNLMQFEDLGEETEKYVCRYNWITERKVSIATEVPGAEKSLEMLSQEYPLFIVTGTIQKSIDIVLKNREMQKYFKKVYGGFRDKKEGMTILIKEQRIKQRSSIFVGDGKSDYECARYLSMPFIGIMNETNDFEKRQDVMWKLYDLEKLPNVIREIKENE